MLKCLKVSKDIKGFYACKNLFKIVINVNMIAFCIMSTKYSNISL